MVGPGGTSDILWLYTLSAINFLAFVVFLMVLGRNVLKLMRERSTNQIGARFKIQLVLFSIAISLLPLIFLFFFSYGLINRSIDKWFSFPAQRILEDATVLKNAYTERELNLLETATTDLAKNVAHSEDKWDSPDWPDKLKTWSGDPNTAYIEVVRGSSEYNTPVDKVAAYGLGVSATLALARGEIRAGKSEKRELPAANNGICLIVWKSVDGTGAILIREVPLDLAAKMTGITDSKKNFDSLARQIRGIKTSIILALAWITVLLLFAAMWFALHMARGITEPIDELVKGTYQVAHGNLDYQVRTQARGELALLVTSFNEMAAELLTTRKQIDKSTSELQNVNLVLEERRGYIETILQSLSTGVISLDSDECLTTINDRAVAMLQLGTRPVDGTPLSEFFGSSNYLAVSKLIRKARRVGNIAKDLELELPDKSSVPTATSVMPLKGADRKYQGTVVMIEDLTELIKAQRSAAWSEVARRMAHEIKNPLTPIQLSAERIARRFKRGSGEMTIEQIEPIVTEGTATIIREVDALKRMVDEFSRFARMPKPKPAPTSLNDVVEKTVALYTDRTNGISLHEKLDPGMPLLNLDSDQFKQVLVNLIDNAIEAISDKSKVGQITIETLHQANEGKVRLVVNDTGDGVPLANRDKLFLPYFSTKRRDTGLGLAIVNHIVIEHGGRIFVDDNKPKGARFVVELPV